MKTVSGMFGGGALIALWEKLPWFVRYPLVGGLMTLGASELNIDVNHALRAPQIFGGQAAQGEAQMVDPTKTRADQKAGIPVSGARALLETQVHQGDAEARQKGAVADAATESIEQIRAKQKAGKFLNSTEQLRLIEYDTKLAELERTRAEAK